MNEPADQPPAPVPRPADPGALRLALTARRWAAAQQVEPAQRLAARSAVSPVVASGPTAEGQRDGVPTSADLAAVHRRGTDLLERAPGAALAFLLATLVVYIGTRGPKAFNYDHFVWQAEAFLHGQVAITWPIKMGPFVNWFFQDVLPVANRPGYGLLPFPPLPAVLLMPFVAVWGLGTDEAVISAAIGAINVLLAWRVSLAVVRGNRAVAALATIFFGFGTVAWYSAETGSTWFLAETVAATFLLLAVERAIALDPRALGAALDGVAADSLSDTPTSRWDAFPLVDPRGVAIGFLFGLASCARLTAIFGAGFFVFVGPGRRWTRRAMSAGIGAAVPFGALLAYTFATTGQLLHPGYVYLYFHEIRPVADGLIAQIWPQVAQLHYFAGSWGITDLRYVPFNTLIAFLWLPHVDPTCPVTGLFSTACPLLRPDPVGTGLFISSPAFLVVFASLRRLRVSRLVQGTWVAIVPVTVMLLAHFSQGWVQ